MLISGCARAINPELRVDPYQINFSLNSIAMLSSDLDRTDWREHFVKVEL